MHSYAHQHECQLVNNPRYRLGIGLSDGEGTERIWSQMTSLVGIERNLSVRISLDSLVYDISQFYRDTVEYLCLIAV